MEQKIINLREQGFSYSQIAENLGCSKSLVCYYVGDKQKVKKLNRQRKNRVSHHPYKKKIECFTLDKRCIKPSRNNLSSIKKLLRYKVNDFMKNSSNNEPTFSVEDVINKFGENPVCYLTGEPIDMSKTSTYNFDHMIPSSRGGDNSLENLGIATKRANQSKTNMTVDEFLNFCKQVVNHLEPKK